MGFILVFFILIIALSAVSAGDASNETDIGLELDESQDAVLEENGGSFTDIQRNITEAGDGDEIEIEGTYIRDDGVISIYKNITIKGSQNGAVLDGNAGFNSIIYVQPNANVHLKNIVFMNTNNSEVISSQGNIFLDNCTFINNLNYNGILNNFDGNSVVTNCKFLNNVPAQYGRIISGFGGNHTIVNCTFDIQSGNPNYLLDFAYAENVYIENTDLPWECIFQETEVTLNKSHIEHGGAFTNCYNCIVVNSRVSSDNFYNCTFNNTSITCRGEFKCNKIINSSLSFVNADNFTIENCQFENLKWAISCSEVNVTIINCHFINISSTAVGSLRDSKSGNLNLSNCEFLNCNGAICWMGDSISLKNCSFINTKDRILYLIVNNGIIDNCTFINTSSKESPIEWTGFSHYAGHDKEYGDVYREYCYKGVLTNSRFINISSSEGWGTIQTWINQFNIENCSFTNIKNTYINSFIRHASVDGEQLFSISNSEFIGCYGKLDIISDNIDLNEVSFINGKQGALETASENLNMTNCKFENNSGRYYGIAYLQSEHMKLDNCTFIKSSSNDDAGALYLDVYENAEVSKCTFINNTGIDGGGILAYGHVKIDNCTFIGNKAKYGSAIHVRSSDVTISSCILVNNTSQIGGAIYGYYYFVVKQIGTYYGETYLKVTVYDKYTNEPLVNEMVCAYAPGESNFKPLGHFNESEMNNYVDKTPWFNPYYKSSKDGSVMVPLPLKPGKYRMQLDCYYLVDSSHIVTIKKNSAKLSAPEFKTSYDSGKYFKVNIKSTSSKKSLYSVEIKIKVYTGKKSKTYTVLTDKNGVARFSLSKLSIGEHKISISAGSYAGAKTISSKITITKAKTTIKAPKVSNKLKKSQYFKVTVKHKESKNPVKNTKVKLKIGKKTYKVKTDKKGVAKFNTKGLKVGKHKVVISSGNNKYTMSAKSQITIKR